MIRLALDLGQHLGWAAMVGDQRMGGTWELTTDKQRKEAAAQGLDRRCDPRFGRMLDRLMEFRGNFGCPDQIIFEDVQFSEYTLQTQLWSSFRAAIWAFQWLRPNVDVQCLDTSRLKVWGAHHGGATKLMMGAWLVKKHPNFWVKNPNPTENCFVRERFTGARVDDNQVDAQHLLDYSIHNFSPCPPI